MLLLLYLKTEKYMYLYRYLLSDKDIWRRVVLEEDKMKKFMKTC